MFNKVAVIGDSDIIFAFRALGIKVFSPGNLEEARKAVESLEKEDIALCFLHESFFDPLRAEGEALRKKFCPVIVGFSDYRKVTDYLGSVMRDVAIKATGSDSLVKRRGEDETR